MTRSSNNGHRARGLTDMSWRRSVSLLCLLVVVTPACSRRPAEKASGVRSSGTPQGSVVARAAGSDLPGHDTLEWYSEPVLAIAELAEVRDAIESRDDELAALTLRDLVSRASTKPERRTRWLYLLGLIEERRQEIGQARAAYSEAANAASPLRWDALMHLADLELSAGNCPLARAVSAKLVSDPTRLDELAALDGRIAACEGDWPTARRHFAVAVERASTADMRVYYQWQLAEGLIRHWGPCGSRPKAESDEIAEFVIRAKSSSAKAPALTKRLGRLISQLACPTPSSNAEATLSQSLGFAEELLDVRRFSEAAALLLTCEVEVDGSQPSMPELCRIQFAQGRAAAGQGKKRDAEQRFDWVAQHCDDRDKAARALFLSGGLLSSRGQHALAIAAYSDLERRFPEHRLADDASLKTAKAYQALGSEKQFVEVLSEMNERYPEGDMTQEGLFLLALNYMLRRDWGPSIAVLERAEKRGKATSVVRPVERDRVAYFLASCRLEQQLTEEGLVGLEALVKTRPLSYYMLLAYSRLFALAPNRASRALDEGLQSARSEGNTVALKYVPSDPRIWRIVALLAAGDLEAANVRMLGVEPEANGSDAFWTMADLYAQAGASQVALAMVKSRAEDIRTRWPVGSFIANWRQAYPRPYLGIVRKNAEANQVPLPLIYAVMREESEFEPTAVSSAEAYGLMQLIVPTAVTAAKGTPFRANTKTLLLPATNIALGTRVLRELLARFDGRTTLAVAGYNAGPGRAKRWLRERPATSLDLWIESIEYAETRGYVKRVLESQAAYGWLYPNDPEHPSIDPIPIDLVTR